MTLWLPPGNVIPVDDPWVITDTHFHHRRMVELCGRPQDFDELIVEAWNATVMPTEVIVHLGDIFLGRNADFAPLMSRLNGIKILVLGNHDHESASWYERRGVMVCVDYAVANDRILLTHRPDPDRMRVESSVDGRQISVPFDRNLHGHFHGNDVWSRPIDEYISDSRRSAAAYRAALPFYSLLSIEGAWAPIRLSEALRRNHRGQVRQ